jgi:hypothetical protein
MAEFFFGKNNLRELINAINKKKSSLEQTCGKMQKLLLLFLTQATCFAQFTR